MGETLVFLDPRVVPWTEQVLRAARQLGYELVLRGKPGVAARVHGLVDQVFESDDWEMPAMRAFRDRMMANHQVAGLATVLGLENPVCMHGAAVAELAAEVGLPHQSVDGIYCSNNKFLARDALRAAGVATVRHAVVRSVAEAREAALAIGYPLVVKPVQLAASSFICRCDDDQQLAGKVEYIQRNIRSSPFGRLASYSYEWPDRRGNPHRFDQQSLILEEYIPGVEACVECVVTEGRAIALLVSEKPIVTEKEHMVLENLSITPPAGFTRGQVEEIASYACDVIRAVGIKNSFVHVEVRYHPARGPLLLEVNPRIGMGMNVPLCIERFTGLRAAEAVVQLCTGRFSPEPAYPTREERYRSGFVGMFAFFPPHGGELEQVTGLEAVRALPGMLDVSLNAPVGSAIDGDNEECFLVTCTTVAQDPDQVFEAYRRASSLIQLKVRRLA